MTWEFKTLLSSLSMLCIYNYHHLEFHNPQTISVGSVGLRGTGPIWNPRHKIKLWPENWNPIWTDIMSPPAFEIFHPPKNIFWEPELGRYRYVGTIPKYISILTFLCKNFLSQIYWRSSKKVKIDLHWKFSAERFPTP